MRSLNMVLLIKGAVLALLSVCVCQTAFAADSVKTDVVEIARRAFLRSESYTWISSGKINMYDSYLSPLLYKGSVFRVGHESMRFYSEHSDKFSQYMNYSLDAALAENPAKNASMSKFLFEYDYGAHYHLTPTENLTVMLGGYSNVDMGVRLLMRNGNNPVSAIVNSNLWLSAVGCYAFKSEERGVVVALRNHLSLAAFGVMFAPKYTQTYFDIFYEGGSDGVVKFTSPNERFAIRNRFVVEVPLRKMTLMAGFDAERIVTNVNLNETRNTHFSFLFGFAKNVWPYSGREKISNRFRDTAE